MHEHNIQDKFLLDLCEHHSQVSVFLVSGIQLRGQIIGFDPFVLTLKKGDIMQMIYKHAISTVVKQSGHATE